MDGCVTGYEKGIPVFLKSSYNKQDVLILNMAQKSSTAIKSKVLNNLNLRFAKLKADL